MNELKMETSNDEKTVVNKIGSLRAEAGESLEGIYSLSAKGELIQYKVSFQGTLKLERADS